MNERRSAETATPLLLLLVFLLALLLRLFHLGHASLWVDELITIWQGTVEGHSLWGQFRDDIQTPLPMVIFATISKFSEGEFWLRLPSALWGAASVPLLYVAGRRVVGCRAALFAALLLALHPEHIHHSQQVRGYAAMLFFGLATTSLVLTAGGKLGLRRGLLLVVVGVATILSNLSGLLWMAGLGFGSLIAGRMERAHLLRWVIAFAAMALLTSPWWAQSGDVHESQRLAPSADTGEALRGETTFSRWSIPYAGIALGLGTSIGPSSAELHVASMVGTVTDALGPRDLPLPLAAGGLIFILLAAGLVALRWRSRELIAWVFLAVAVALWLGIRNVKPFNPRYVLVALPSLLLFFGAGLDRMARQPASFLLAAWIVLAGISLQRQWFDSDYLREDVRAAVRIIELREGGDDLIVAPSVNKVVEHYYRGSSPVHPFMGHSMKGRAEVETALDELDTSRRFLWYVRSRPWFGDPRGDLKAILAERYRVVGRSQVPGVELLLYDRARQPLEDGGSR